MRLKEYSGGQNTWEGKLGLRRQQKSWWPQVMATFLRASGGNSMTATAQVLLHTAQRDQVAPLPPVYTDNDRSETTQGGRALV